MTWLVDIGVLLISLLGAYLLFYSFYWMSSVILGATYKSPSLKPLHTGNEILVLLPAYKPNAVFIEVLHSLKKAIKSRTDIKPIILLQQADIGIADQVKQFGYHVVEKDFSQEKGNPYHHALKFVMTHIEAKKSEGLWSPTHIAILDKDNIVAEDFFRELERGFQAGYDLVQGQRLPFSQNTSTQSFDAISERLNDMMFRAAKSKLGLMLEISGSGFGVRYNLMQNAVDTLDFIAPGMDKNLMVGLLKQNVKSLYVPSAKVYEEKTASEESFKKQRTRWLGVQYYIAMHYGLKLVQIALLNFRFSAMDYAISLWRPPRSVQLALVPVLAFFEVLSLAVFSTLPYPVPFMSLSLLMLAVAFVVFILKEKMWGSVQDLVVHFPKLALGNLQSALEGIKPKHRGSFIHTDHQTITGHEER
jgi:cellulose synthase/poly-beta-1,6-N-acetylglucosamine synthase-like glycosyltransferase